MAQQTIYLGTAPDAGDGDTARAAFDICNDNFSELYARGTSSGRTTRISGRYYPGGPSGSNLTGASAPAITTTYWLPEVFDKAVQLSEFGVIVLTGGGNTQVALYARDPVTGYPTGVCLARTNSIDTSAAGNKNGAVAAGSLVSGGVASIPAGEYMWAVQHDSTLIRCVIPNAADCTTAQQAGSTTLAALASGVNMGPVQLLLSGTYGTWPDVTSATFTQDNAIRASARPFYKVA